MLGELGGDEIGRGRGDRDGGLGRRGALARPAESLGLGQPGEVLGGAAEVDPARGRRQEVEERLEERRLAGALLETRDDQGQPRLDEDPGEGGQLGVEDAVGDQLDDRAARRGGRGRRNARRSSPSPRMMTGVGKSAGYDAGMRTTPRSASAAPARRSCSPRSMEIVPLTPDRWDDVHGPVRRGRRPEDLLVHVLAGALEGLVVRERGEVREGFQALVDADRDPAPGLLAYAGGRAVGWVSVAPASDYQRLDELARPAGDRRRRSGRSCASSSRDRPAARASRRVCSTRRRTTRSTHGAPASGGLSGGHGRRADPGRGRLHGAPVDLHRGRLRGRPRDRLAAGNGPAGDRPARAARGADGCRAAFIR